MTIMAVLTTSGTVSAHDIFDWMNTPSAAAPWRVFQEQQQIVRTSKLSKQQQDHILLWANQDNRWPNPTIKVCFTPPPPDPADAAFDRQVQARIVAVAPLWLEGTKLTFDFGQGDALNQCEATGEDMVNQYQIRILTYPHIVAPNTFAALIGNQAQTRSLFPGNFYSVVLVFDPASDTWTQYANFYILHEIGHALGALHEHQRVDCSWNIAAIKAKNIPGLTDDSGIKQNLKKFDEHDESMLGSAPHVVSTPWDKGSVMAYNFQPWYFTDSEKDKCFRAPVDGLSPSDKIGMQKLYEGVGVSASADVEGAVRGGRPLAALDVDLQAHLADARLGRPAGGAYDKKVASLAPKQRKIYQRRIESEFSPEERVVLEQVLAVRAKYEKGPPVTKDGKATP